ncbi:fibronectin type III domain-containing protein [Paenibacillus lutimineralis]|uniref:Fibronectin type-III domain-containing protein n=1 Tax=Paenibacillus lutimineralis TaxID=2707005 RepID=A0A3Q9I9S4_9BACL|nr:fibronectin type III domain-containing protein [Paenibacillus lutimineralis]AZS15946.1 hypothetical protein EI981_16895 [Paenibacillus lutimineralis]
MNIFLFGEANILSRFRRCLVTCITVLSFLLFDLQAYGSTTYYNYDSSNRLIHKTVTSSSGEKTSWEYTNDQNGSLIRRIVVGNLDSLTNSDFELYSGNNGVADHWEIYGNGNGNAIYDISNSSYSGKQSQRISASGISSGSSIGLSQTIAIQGRRSYILGGYYRVIDLFGATAQLKIEFYNSSSVLVGSEFQEINEPNQGYEHITIRGNVPVNAVKAKVIIAIHSITSGSGRIEVDNTNFEYPQSVNLIAGGRYVTYGLRNDGKVWGWGTNSSDKYTRVPSELPGFENIKSLALGNQNRHVIAIKEDGTVLTYSHYNNGGEAGDGTTEMKYTPVVAVGLTDVISVTAGYDYTVALKKDGTVWAWGGNNYGQLGDGTTINRSIPVQVEGISNVVGVAAGDDHTVALKSDGTVWTWGFGDSGRLGDGSGKLHNTPVPTQVPGLNNIKAVTAGYSYTLVLDDNGKVWGFGRNGYGELGIGSTKSMHSPVQIPELEVIAIAAGGYHSLALKADGTVMAWGRNWSGEIGDGLGGKTNEQLTPTQVLNLTGVDSIAAGEEHSIALKADGTLWTWGDNTYGQIGTGDGKKSLFPIPVWTRGYESIPPTKPNNLIIVEQTANTVTLEWETSSDNSGIAGYDIYNYDSKLTRSRTNRVTLEKLETNKTYLITVKAVDLSGNVSEPSNSVVIQTGQDTEPPTVPTKLTKVSSTYDSVTLKWEASKDNVGVAEYELFKDGEQVAVTTQLTVTIYGLTEGGTYTFTVRAKDMAGNVSEHSLPLIVTLSSDHEPPTAPTNLAASIISVTSARLSWTKSTDNVGVVGYDIYLISDSDPDLIATSTTNSYTLNELQPNTTYTVMVRARDNAGNQSADSSNVSFTTKADTTKPSTPTNLTLVTMTNNSVTLKWDESTDNVGVVAYDIFEGTNLVATVALPSGGVINLLPSTPYRFTVVARDAAGNKSSPSVPLNVTIIPDNESPSAPTNLTYSETLTNSIKLVWDESTDNVGVVGYQIYRDSELVGTSSVNNFQDMGLVPGTSYRYEIIAIDSSGNLSLPSESLIVSTASSSEHDLLQDSETE